MSIESAELAKVAYNTAISTKIAVANTVMEICHKIPRADTDAVTQAMQAAYRRIVSPAYMTGGMGDGGGCHPRDNIAMSDLARRLNLSHNLFDDIMQCRDDQAKWLAELMISESDNSRLPIGIYGVAYKPNVKITTGSPALLVEAFLAGRSFVTKMLDPVIDEQAPDVPRVWLLGCAHDRIEKTVWPEGSIVIDPFRIVPNSAGIRVIRIGEETA